ncbi:MAG TPA: acyl carrier protein [Acetobacteraceae bacterium]|nr:acyl carrier protein [Acetobacteraceae bacterium]HET8995614.1 acyl carrier protein [Acetobacteraceae bacterium]
MTDNEILGALNAIFRHVLDDPSIALTPSTTADDVPGWDSMTQITLAVEIEHALGVKFKTSEMEEMRNIGDLVALVHTHLTAVAG